MGNMSSHVPNVALTTRCSSASFVSDHILKRGFVKTGKDSFWIQTLTSEFRVVSVR